MYSGENFRFRFNPLRDFIYSTQFLQAEAMKYAYNHWRRAFGGPGAELCSGILVWQLNDIWPGTSWALVDSEMSLKPSFHITKRALAKVVVGVERLVTKKTPYMVTSYPPSKTRAAIWAVNGFTSSLPATLHLSAFDIETGSSIALPDDVRTRKVTLKPNQTTEIVDGIDIPDADTTVLYASLVADGEQGEQLARWVDVSFLPLSPSHLLSTRLFTTIALRFPLLPHLMLAQSCCFHTHLYTHFRFPSPPCFSFPVIMPTPSIHTHTHSAFPALDSVHRLGLAEDASLPNPNLPTLCFSSSHTPHSMLLTHSFNSPRHRSSLTSLQESQLTPTLSHTVARTPQIRAFRKRCLRHHHPPAFLELPIRQ